MKLYPFQNDGVEELIRGFKTERAQCLAYYTGAGKTNMIADLCRRYIKENPNVKIGISAYLITQIKDQITDRLGTFGLSDVTQKIMPRAAIQKSKAIFVFNPQALHTNPPDIKFDLFIIDEGHAGMNEQCTMLRKIIAETCNKKTKILIVSATPWDTLALKEFKDIPVLKRPLDRGLADGLITDFKFHAEAAQITFKEEDFNRTGDLGISAAQRQMAILKSACIGKLHHIIDNYGKELGEKVIVICPVGNYTEIARTMAEEFGGLTYIQERVIDKEDLHGFRIDQNANLEKFKSDPRQRFLFVANKCSVGFDMPELTAIVDLTMTRNIRTLAQRIGRIARKHKTLTKHYFYVYDQSLMKDRLEWLVATMIDFCLGAYEGWTTKTVKYRRVNISHWSYREPFALTLSEVVDALRGPELIQNMRTLSYLAAHGPPRKWTLEVATGEAKKYESRIEMWSKNPALYKWFRLNAKAEMDAIFPLKHHIGKWNEKTVIAAMKKCDSRIEWKKRFSGAEGWVCINGRSDLKEKYLPPSKSRLKWTDESIYKMLKTVRTWAHMRSRGGARRWMCDNGGEAAWKKKWMAMRPKKRRSA